MADRGILIQDLFASKCVKVSTPATLRGEAQLEPDVEIRDRRVYI